MALPIHVRLAVAFVLCMFEYLSLGFLSLEPGRQIVHNYFPYGKNTTASDDDA